MTLRGFSGPVRLLAGAMLLAASNLAAIAQGVRRRGRARGRQGARATEELGKVQAEQKRSADLAAKLKAEIDAIGEDRRKLNQLVLSSAASIRAVEDRIAAAEKRLNSLSGNEDTIRRSLGSRRAVIAEVLAALQRLGRHPPPALLVRPEDALQSVRAAILLGAVLPDMKTEVDTLVADLAELVRVRSEIASERETLGRDLAALSQERSRMTVLVQERQRKQADTEKALESERGRAIQLARQAENLKDLIGKIEQEIATSARAAAAAQKPADPKQSLAALNDPDGSAPRLRSPRPRARCRCRSAASEFANSAPSTAWGEPKKACQLQAVLRPK
jgi:septal ring factor EnvC (AmiA/AmiB activator)